MATVFLSRVVLLPDFLKEINENLLSLPQYFNYKSQSFNGICRHHQETQIDLI